MMRPLACALWTIAVGIFVAAASTIAHAAPIMFVDRAQFDSVLGAVVSQRPDASVRLENFDGVFSGTVIHTNGEFGGIQYTYNLPRGPDIQTVVQVTNGGDILPTTSEPNFLGTKDINLPTS